MKPADKDYEMERFKKGITHIMVSTTVIEVGVDVPNATVMVIENSERFGLAQLHQLRGRVGRGGEQSYCILMTADKLSYDGRERISTMVRTNDGFEISEADLKLRGPGDLQGLQQSGVVNLKVADEAMASKLDSYTAVSLLVELDMILEVNAPNYACGGSEVVKGYTYTGLNEKRKHTATKDETVTAFTMGADCAVYDVRGGKVTQLAEIPVGATIVVYTDRFGAAQIIFVQ